jgi:hypothetical protein
VNEIIDINQKKPHKCSEVICVKCCYRWVAARPEETLLKELECHHCGGIGFAIETGEELTKCLSKKAR